MIYQLIKKLIFGWGLSGNSISNSTEQKIKTDWQYILTLLKSKSPASAKQALITADKSFDAALKDISNGESMGERLKNAKDSFDISTYDKIWQAHKLRNNLVHESGYEPPVFLIKEAIETYKEVLAGLGVKI